MNARNYARDMQSIHQISPFAACFVTRGHLENRTGRKHASKLHFGSTVTTEPSYRKTALAAA
jgi:hypothetical protein